MTAWNIGSFLAVLCSLASVAAAQERTVGDRIRAQEAAAITPAFALRCIALAGSHKLPDTDETESIRFGLWNLYERYVSHEVGGTSNVTTAAEPVRARLDQRLTLDEIMAQREACALRVGTTTVAPPPSEGPNWIRRAPAFYPERASARGVLGGEVVAHCEVAMDGRLTNCAILSENPAGVGFGAAVLAAAVLSRVHPASATEVTFTTRFAMQTD